MGTSHYSEGFKRDGVQQITVRGYAVRGDMLSGRWHGGIIGGLRLVPSKQLKWLKYSRITQPKGAFGFVSGNDLYCNLHQGLSRAGPYHTTG